MPVQVSTGIDQASQNKSCVKNQNKTESYKTLIYL